MADSTKAIEMILKQEGGFVNNPADRGGATNFGITQKTYESFVGRPVTVEEVRTMPQGNAIVIYKEKYWNLVRGDEIKDEGVAYVLFDLAVHSGPSRAIKQMQMLYGLPETGIMSDEEVRFINSTDAGQFIEKFLEATLNWYLGIVQRDSSQSIFLNGWKNRVNKARVYAYSVSNAKTPILPKIIFITGASTFFGLFFYIMWKSRHKISRDIKEKKQIIEQEKRSKESSISGVA